MEIIQDSPVTTFPFHQCVENREMWEQILRDFRDIDEVSIIRTNVITSSKLEVEYMNAVIGHGIDPDKIRFLGTSFCRIENGKCVLNEDLLQKMLKMPLTKMVQPTFFYFEVSLIALREKLLLRRKNGLK